MGGRESVPFPASGNLTGDFILAAAHCRTDGLQGPEELPPPARPHTAGLTSGYPGRDRSADQTDAPLPGTHFTSVTF